MVFYLITCVRVTIDKNSLENIFIYYHIASIKMKEAWNTIAEEMNNYLILNLMLTAWSNEFIHHLKQFYEMFKIDIVKNIFIRGNMLVIYLEDMVSINVIQLSETISRNSYIQNYIMQYLDINMLTYFR